MARLKHPAKGTVVRCEGDLATHYLSLGWVDCDKPAQQKKATSDKPSTKRERSRKTD